MNLETTNIAASRVAWPPAPARWQPNRARLRHRFYVSLMALDQACLFLSFLLASFLYGPARLDDQWFIFTSIVAPIYFCVALNGRAYAIGIVEDPVRAMLRSIQALALSIGIVVLVAFYLKTSQDFSRAMVAIGSLSSLVSLLFARWQFIRRARTILGGNPYSVALIVDGACALDPSGFSFIIHSGSDLNPDDDCPVMLDRLASALKDADRVVVACPVERRINWVRMLKGANVRSEIVAPELLELAPLALDRCAGMPTMVVADGPLGKIDSALKRVFDIVLSAVAMIVLAPAMLLVAVLIKLGSAGPVFFVQTRIGQGNRMFRMFKFRSMRVDRGDTAGTTSTRRDDDRITPIGRFIRRTSIDELPQFLNVFTGDMSIVGPRPHALGSRAEDKLFWEVDNRYWHRHAAKPGLTGLAQIRGFRGATEREADLTNRLQADLEYLHAWSLWRDVVIIVHTFRVLIHKNAY